MARPLDTPNLDSYLLGTVRSPGRVKFQGLAAKKNWKVDPAKGNTGASTTLNGDTPPSFQAIHSLANDENKESADSEFAQWTAFRRIVESTTSGPKPVALPIVHPDAQENGITEVSNGGIEGPVYDGLGGKQYTITYQVYKPPKKKPAAKPGVKPGATTGVADKPDPNADVKAELAAALAEAKKPS